MHIVCSDLEGVFIPEIWINFAEVTGIRELRLTTRDISDYDVLMKRRLAILDEHRLTLRDIQSVIRKMDPLPGALDFLDWLRSQTQVIILSDTFEQFARPLLEKLGRPTLFCHSLDVADDGRITGYRLRQQDSKKKAVLALQGLCFRVFAMGDSYNDLSMIQTADSGFLFNPPENVRTEFPQFPVAENYEDLRDILSRAFAGQEL